MNYYDDFKTHVVSYVLGQGKLLFPVNLTRCDGYVD
jgi:hypothetical protein